MDNSLVFREIILAFWKVHILHHAAEKPVYGQWIIGELRRHGYDIKTGTLYPLLRRMEKNGWLAASRARRAGPRGRVNYRLTSAGREVLACLREKTRELAGEILPGAPRS
ncbi:MAG: PadR family transcriptional regulator [Elusimicrobia bacterium]|nr:MAG: PadR family transcriptional regulator [Elusimicrobiota bacterium]KAF0153901.1 MAG: PadR family transcriptional regulator [Elusimicrobiota bacterium]